MPGKGKPFVANDPRRRPGPGRPKLAYLEAMRSLTPEAVKVLRRALQSKNPREALHAAESVLNRAYGKPKETVQLDHETPLLVMPDSLYQAREKLRHAQKQDAGETE